MAEDAIVVGVQADQPEAVIQEALRFAVRFGGRLEFVQVDTGRYVIDGQFGEDPLVERSMPLDSDAADSSEDPFDPAILERLDRIVGDRVPWQTHQMAGDVAHALATLADRVDAVMIIVGTKEPSLRRTVQEVFSGAVGARLAHRQHQPVLMIPLSPVDDSEPLPWS
ncbi:universal stress protein [Rathayibacter sp. VKM Ac-2760]|uniref:universal stress protein n=1 Tax=Rathayibacter sp. VKM Ac-2760 TaxID=2609253 RepID=UPI00131799EF|nr:universal stress protein [Rathayibacter sp. VKM Ac-2760]QHC57417.1 universal stress protein [Rathayibacter sp. VKM Ac-2760]